MNRLTYLTTARLPTEKAHGIQIMKTCERFAAEGFDVHAYTPLRAQPLKRDAFDFYGTPHVFALHRLPALDLMRPFGAFGFRVMQATFAASVFFGFLFRSAWRKSFVFGRDALPLLAATVFTRKVIWELHDFTPSIERLLRRWQHRFAGFVVTNQWKKDQLVEKIGISPERIHVAPNGVDLHYFSEPFDRESFRETHGWNRDEKIVMYVGKFYAWKGVQTLLAAARLLPAGFRVVCVGGTVQEAEALAGEKLSANVECIAHVPHHDVSKYLRAADILSLPNSAMTEESKYTTSPIKSFEYMASGIPIVASDLPSIREILSDETAVFVPPDDAASLVEAILGACDKIEPAKERADRAKETALQFSWTERTRRIIEWMNRTVR